MVRWFPKVALSKREQFLIGRMTRTGKLFAFLRQHRHELFDRAFQAELEGMYRTSGEGKEPVAPALLAMVLLLQSYMRASDAQAVELAIVDARWQMVLGVLGDDEAPFSQGALPAFRQRLIAHDMDRRLLERTIELARESGGFDWKKLPKDLRIAVDSRPLEGAGRVEDTFNLLAHAARNVLVCAARLADLKPDEAAEIAGSPLLIGASVKAQLDIEWSDRCKRPLPSGLWWNNSIGWSAGSPTSSAMTRASRRSPSLWQHSGSFASRTSIPSRPTTSRAFERVQPRIAASRSRTKTCAMGARASRSASTDTRGTSPAISIRT